MFRISMPTHRTATVTAAATTRVEQRLLTNPTTLERPHAKQRKLFSAALAATDEFLEKFVEVVEEAVNPHDEHALTQFFATICKDNVIRNKLPKYAAGTGFAKTLQALVTLSATATQTCTSGMAAAAQAVQYSAAPCTPDDTNGATTAARNMPITGHNGENGTGTEVAGSTAPNTGETPSATRADTSADTAATVTANATNVATTPPTRLDHTSPLPRVPHARQYARSPDFPHVAPWTPAATAKFLQTPSFRRNYAVKLHA